MPDHSEKPWAKRIYQKKDVADRALEFFDVHYRKVLGSKWSSVRIALLCAPKYGAVVNSFSARSDKVCERLSESGALNICAASGLPVPAGAKRLIARTYRLDRKAVLEDEKEESADDTVEHDGSGQDLYSFMPVTMVHANRQLEQIEEDRQATNGVVAMQSEDDFIKFIPAMADASQIINGKLSCWCFEAGDISGFPRPKADQNGLLDYYLLDAASILPVLALNPQPEDKVLDMCAAPGGKSLAILQSCVPEILVSCDKAISRLRRLNSVLSSYVPADLLRGPGSLVHTVLSDARELVHPSDSPDLFDKVLVDVPCLMDRHTLSTVDNNLFSVNRRAERMEMPTYQSSLLQAGLKLCRVGGVVVYSTCTLLPAQNDGVVHSALEALWHTTDTYDFAIEDTSPLVERTWSHFRFSSSCRYGQLVLPWLTQNFGPTYFAKLRRLR